MDSPQPPLTTLQIHLPELATLISDAIKQRQAVEQKEALSKKDDQLEAEIRDLKEQLADERARAHALDIRYENEIQKLKDSLRDVNQRATNLLESIGEQLERLNSQMFGLRPADKGAQQQAQQNAEMLLNRLMEEIQERAEDPFMGCLHERGSVNGQPPLLSSKLRTKAMFQHEGDIVLKVKRDFVVLIDQIVGWLVCAMENAPRATVREILGDLERIRTKLVEKQIELNVGNIDGQ